MKNFTLPIVLLLFFSSSIQAAMPTCHSSNGGYCRYSGKISEIYVNAGNLILIYFDTPVDLSVPASIGYSVSKGTATAFDLDENPEFGKLFYSTALAAQASGRAVTIQMRGTESGYLKFDRIWLPE